MKFLDLLGDMIGGLWAFIGVVALFGTIGYVLYYNYRGTTGIALFVILSVIGLISGIYIAGKLIRARTPGYYTNKTNEHSEEQIDL